MLLSAASRVTQLSSSRQRAQLALRHGARRRPVARRRDAPFRSRAPSRPSFIAAREELGPRGNDSQVSGAARCLAVVARAEPPPPDAAQLDAQRPRREVVLRDHAQKHAPRGQATVAGRSAAQTKDSIGAPRPFAAEQQRHLRMSRDVPTRPALGPRRDDERRPVGHEPEWRHERTPGRRAGGDQRDHRVPEEGADLWIEWRGHRSDLPDGPIVPGEDAPRVDRVPPERVRLTRLRALGPPG
jgi:hypothetical protein